MIKDLNRKAKNLCEVIIIKGVFRLKYLGYKQNSVFSCDMFVHC